MKKSITLVLCLFALALCVASVRAEQHEVKCAFKPLPPGAIRPEGWLRDWAEAARDGITGHLDERSNTFSKGWSGEHFRAAGVKPHGTGWPLEQCAYWLDGLVRLAYILDDQNLIQKAKSRLDPIVDGVLDGNKESFIYWRPKSALNDSFNNWAHSHLARALVAYYQATGDKRILDALVKVYRYYPVGDIPIDVPFHEVSGAVNLDPMVETYLMSRDPQVLQNILAYTRSKPFGDLLKNWLTGDVLDGHNVIFYENVRVPALAYLMTGDRRMLDASLRVLQRKSQAHGLPLGLTSGEEYHSGIGSTRYVETCNVACGGWTNYWLLRILGDRQYGDTMEAIFFNAAPVPLSRDFQLVSYYQVLNRTDNVLKPADGVLPGEPPRVCDHTYSKLGHGPLCCVGNCNRIVPHYIEHMWMIAPDGSPAAMVYGPCVLKTKVNGVPLTIKTETEYPFETSMVMCVRPERKTKFSLGLRIPQWCDTPTATVNGRSVSLVPDKHGFASIKRTWGLADEVRLNFPMRASVVKSHETPFPVIPRGKLANYHVRKLAKCSDATYPFAYVKYGPLLFAMPIADKTPNEPVDGAAWNYALDVAPDEAQSQIEVVRQKMKRPWNWSLDAPVKLVVNARQFDWHPTITQPLPSTPITDGRPAKITLVPYGCTKFHITMFPITNRMNKQSGSSATE